MKEGNGGKPEQVSIFPSKMFTDLEDPASRERFKGLMKFQYGFSDEQLDRDIELLRKQERWKTEANFYLAEITDCEHEYFGRIGQLIFAMGTSFVDNEPTYKLDSERLQNLLEAGKEIEYKLALVIKIDVLLIHIAEDGDQYRLLNKFELGDEEIVVEDEDGRTGVLVGWRKNDQEGLPFGFYTVRFGDEIVEADDWLMMQDPRWQFRRKVENESQS